MGMYDYVLVTCPQCDEWIENQTKVGPCQLAEFKEGDKDFKQVIDGVDGMWWDCGKCGCRFLTNWDVLVTKHVFPKV